MSAPDLALRKESKRVGLSEEELCHYSIGRMIQSTLTDRKVDAEFEQEVSEVIARTYQRKPKGFYVPSGVLSRDLTTGNGPGGGFLVGSKVSPFVLALRNKMVVAKAGANFLPGLRESVSIPKVEADPATAWVTEGTGAPESDATFGQISMSPKTVSAYVEITRQLATQLAPEVLDGVVINSLARALALAIDQAALSGTGTAGMPRGIVNTVGVGTVSGASISWATITGMEKAVLNANANDETISYVCHPNVRDLLKSRQKASGSSAYLCTEDNRVNGYPCFATKQLADELLLCGDFSQLYIGEWGALDILLNPYTIQNGSIVAITAFSSVDTALAFPQAFVVASGVN